MKKPKIGKELANHLYVHRSAINKLPEPTLNTIKTAYSIGKPKEFDMVKIAKDGSTVSFSKYPNFDEDPHPIWSGSTNVDLRTGSVKELPPKKPESAQILHRKEAFVTPDYEHYDKFRRLTQQEEAAGLLSKEHTSRIGYKSYWDSLLDKKNLTIRNHELISIGENKMEKAKKKIGKKMQDRLSEKIRLLHHEGHPHDQSIAIAMNMLGLSKKSLIHVVTLSKADKKKT